MITDEQRDQMLVTAAEDGLWTELADLLAHLGADERTQFANRLHASPEAVRAAVATSTLDPGALAALGAA
jgi:hypothetical protein